MKKRLAQISIFVIIALVLVAIIAGLIILQKNKPKSFDSLSFQEQIPILQESVEECMRGVYQESLNNVGIQGGYYGEPVTPYLDTGLYNIPFYYFGELVYTPDVELIEGELSSAVDFSDVECLELITEKNFGYDYSYLFTNVSVTDDAVIFTPHLIATISKDTETAEIDFRKNPITIDSNLKEMNSFASYVAYSHDINNGSVCISCFVDIANENGLSVEMVNDFDSVLSVYIVDNRTNFYPQIYSFAITNLPKNKTELNIIQPEDIPEFNDQEINAQPPEV